MPHEIMNMKYQLVLQLPASSIRDFDSLVLIEEKMDDVMGKKHIVDGHDFGSGEMSIFIHTDDPDAAFELAKTNLDDLIIAELKVAYRKLDGEEYKVIWPENFQGEFNII